MMRRLRGKKISWPVARAGGEDASDQAAALDEPARGDRRPEHQRHRARAQADHDAPQRHELPDDCISELRPTATASVDNATSMTRRTPKRAISAPANGPHRPNSSRLTDRASETVARSQPKSCSRGSTSTALVARIPADASSARNVTPATIQA